MPTSTDAGPLTVLCGFWQHATFQAAQRLLAERPGLRLMRWPTAAALDDLPEAATPGAAGLLVVVAEDYEPDQIRTAWSAHSRGTPPSVTTVVPADLFLDGLCDETTLREAGLNRTPSDERGVGEVVGRQVEQADAVLLHGQPEGDDEWEADQLRVLLHRIAPWAGHRRPGDPWPPAPTARREPIAPVTRGLRGYAVGVHEPVPAHGVASCVFRARRPFHPGRLHDALDEVTEGVLRSRGHFWLASRPDLVMTWESAGGLRIGPHSGWLAGLPDEHWDDVDAERRLAAALDWDPYYDDRHHHLAFVGIDVDPVRIHRRLAGCLLTDEELSQGEQSWRRLPDPFSRAYLTTAGDPGHGPRDIR